MAQHSKPGDYFIALYGQVIDISNFISKHPGGEKILVANAGKDATQKFESLWVAGYNISVLLFCRFCSFFFCIYSVYILYIFVHLAALRNSLELNIQ